MDREDFKQLLKQLYQPVSLVALGIGFVLVVVIAVLLYLLSRQPQLAISPAAQAEQRGLATVTQLPANGVNQTTTKERAVGALPVKYIVSQGDSSWRIARAFYGDGRKYQEIEKANLLMPDQWLEIGQELLIPNLDQSGNPLPPTSVLDLTSGSDQSQLQVDEYIVQPDDSLWWIALKYLNQGHRWTQIYSLNQEVVGVNPHLLKPGTKLKLPPEILQ